MLPFLTMEENRLESTSQAIGYQNKIVTALLHSCFFPDIFRQICVVVISKANWNSVKI